MNIRTCPGLLLACGALGALLPASAAWGQLGDPRDAQTARPSATRTPGAVTVTTTPPGAIVTLEGQGLHLVGRSPWTITRGLDGIFTLRSSLDVHEEARTTVYLSPTSNETIHLDLSAKTPVKAAMRSILLPGWGQHYSGRDVPAVLYFGSALAAGAYLGVTAIRYENQLDDIDVAYQAYKESTVQSERETLWEAVETEREIAEDRQNDRTTAWAILGVVWGVNLLDSLFFFPDAATPTITRSGDTGLFVEPRSDGMDLGLRVGY